MRTLILAAMLVLFAGQSAVAQRSPTRELASSPTTSGLWYNATLGHGIARVACDICRGGRPSAVTGSFRIGGVVSRRVLFGGELSGFMGGEGRLDEHLWTIGAVGQFYLRGAPRAFVKAGIAAMSYRIADGRDILGATGIGGQFGVGYDIPIAPRYSITPSVMITRSLLGGQLKFNDAPVGQHARISLIQIGAGMTRR
jgi:hypothetical protein